MSAISPGKCDVGRQGKARWIGTWGNGEPAVSTPGIRIQPITPEIALPALGFLAIFILSATRLIVATARHLGALLITDDQLLLDYGAAKHLKALKAGR